MLEENFTKLEALAAVQSSSASPDEAWIVSLAPLRLISADSSPVRAFAYKL
jgi:kynurenine formamidase